jgi:RHS repeat-associated protein
MIKRFLTALVLPSLFILLLQQKVSAQFEEGKQDIILTHLDGTAITDGANIPTTYSGNGEINHTIVNIVTLKIDEQSATFPLSAFTATLDFTAETRATVSPQSTLRTDHGQLIVNYDPATGAKYNVRSYQQLLISEDVKITVDHIAITGQTGTWNPLSLLHLENEMRITRYFLMSNDPATLVPTFNNANNYTDALGVSWNWNNSLHNNLSQLEWAWVETEMEPFYTQNNVLNTAMLFQDNSTRVDLDYGQNSFKIPLLYPGPGKLYYRVRPAVRKNDGTVITGPWSTVQNFGFDGHEPNLNWQSSTSFAENGKSKTLIQYFDGSLRSRQTVTKDNVTGNTIVGETIYDLQGRPNVQILPTPTIDNVMGYFRNFNRFQGQLDATDPANFFDLTPADVKCSSAPPLDISKGNGRYYSSNNPWLATESKSAYIPNAYGYAYTETRFMDDATERVSVQGGVGANHQIGSGHETKYFYGKPNQHELDALFGTEAGDATHYSKNMVQDANGQMSVSYVDMHGRTVATALAGKSPDNLISINNTADYPQASSLLKNELLTPANNAIKGSSIESVSTILVPDLTDYHFTYQFNPAIFSQLSPVTNQSVCFDCKYDLEISIRPEDCNAAAPVIKRYSNLQVVPADQACGTPMGFVGEGISTPTQEISFTQSLSAGSWVIRKTLVINDSMFALRRDSAMKVFMVHTQQHFYDSIYTLLSAQTGCGLPAGNTAPCDSCNAHLGTYSQYETSYLAAIGNPTGFDLSIIHAQYSQDSLACAETCGHSSSLSTLAGLRSQMLADMMPFTGQYAIDPKFDASGNPTAFSTASEQAKYNIFTTTPAVSGKTKAFYIYPKTETGAGSSYFSDDNSTDNTMYASAGVLNLSMQDFANRFERSWANSLLYYHPEFAKLKFAENNLASSYAWQDKVQFTETYAQAQSLGYLDPVNSDPYFVNNLNTTDKTNINRYLTQYIGNSNTPSVWRIANASVLCATLTDDQKQNCIMGTTATGLDSRITSTADKDKVWQTFKATYLSYRNEMLVNYINANNTGLGATAMSNLQTEGKQLVFTNAQGVANQNGAGSWWSIAANASQPSDTVGLGNAVNAYVNANNLNGDKCIAQRPIWADMLTRCEQLTTLLNKNTHSDSVTVNNIINQILDGMVQVCHQSQTAFQPYGASTVNPNYTGTPQSFEQVINQVFTSNSIVSNIADSNYFCNPFSVEAPKPFGKNAPLFTNYTNHIDSCGCSRFATLKQEATQAGGYNVSSMTSMNQFLRANYNDTLSLTVWQGLQQCSSLYRDTCSLTTMVIREEPMRAGPSYTERLDNSNPNPCTVYTPIPLTDFVAMPAFLDCGYQKPCLSCAQLASLTTEFKNLYPAYNAVPYMSSSATDAESRRNNLWARFLNYRTGFSLSVMDYMAAIKNCNLDSTTAFIGNGNDCGNQTAVDSLLVNGRLSPYPTDYFARRTIEFQGSFESNDNDEFSAELDSTLGNCSSTYGIAGTTLTINNGYALCAFDKPVNDISRWEPVDTLSCRQADTRAQFVAQLLFGKIKDSLTANFDSLYMAKCLGARGIEQFYATYQPSEYHYTLYYYDQAGNLVKTLPPAAVKPNYDPVYLANTAIQRNAVADLLPGNNEILATQYRYNTLNQVVAQHTPDAGNSQFWYDRLGRLAVSQNAKQQIGFNVEFPTWKKYSYTLYDYLGRITEVGQLPQGTGMTQTISQDTTALKAWIANNIAGNKEQITLTVYDIPYTSLAVSGSNVTGLYQQNLRNRVSYTMVFNADDQRVDLLDGTTSGGNSATFYSYDIHGNVDTLLQDYRTGIMANHGNRYKKIVYAYDLISGKVNDVSYQPSQRDAFYHHYNYDAENRLVSVQTSTDKIYWETEASYDYYRHGPLNKVVLGQNQVQNLNYAYTIQGWLKGVNKQVINNITDIDGNHTESTTALGFSLGYFNGDFNPIGGNNAQAFANSYAAHTSAVLFGGPPAPFETGSDLYNGNISWATYAIKGIDGGSTAGYTYGYDQLNRLKIMNRHNYPQGTVYQRWDINTVISDYHEQIEYDPNGNIKTYLRNGNAAQMSMDNLTYQYEKNALGLQVSNKLRYIHDQVSDANYTSDIDNQTTLALSQVQNDNNTIQPNDNYNYDAIGNLQRDFKEGISAIDWTVYGKIKSVSKISGGGIQYTYDAIGNRISKTMDSSGTHDSTFYVRDASGNVMAVYKSYQISMGPTLLISGGLLLTELHMYGNNRLGIYNKNINLDLQQYELANFSRGNKFFELSNHLGNVLATVSDKKIPVSSNNTSIDYYTADVVSATDYYPFGMQMPGRTFTQANSAYRYGFNGKENDNEVKGQGNEQDYGMRIYDPRVGRFLSVDPLTPKYPELTPYQFASNRTIDGIDRDGLEYCPTIPRFQTDAGNGWDYVAAVDNGLVDVLNLVPQLWNSGVATVQNVKKGTYWRTLGSEFKATGSQLKDVGIKIWNQPLKTLTSPDAVEFLSSAYIGGKIIPVGGGAKGNLMKPATAAKNVATVAKDITEEQVLLKEYGGPGGGHHIPAKSAFIGAAGYDLNKALAIPNAELARLGINHGVVTGAQMVAYKAFANTGATLTWEAMSTIETNALIKGGLNAASAKGVVIEAINDLKKAGVTNPTRIPWGGK